MKIELGPKVFSFETHAEWLGFTAYHWRKKGTTSAQTICIDQANRVCRSGVHFLKALVENKFPVDVYLLRTDLEKAR